MQKSVKKIMPLTLGLLAIALSGCGAASHSIADSIAANYKFVSLFEGEKKALEIRTTPRSADPADLAFESSDNSVVSVSETGELNAKSAGDATVTIKDKNSGVTETVYVSVDKDNLTKGDAKKAGKAISDYQVSHRMDCTKVTTRENHYYSRLKNDVLQRSTYYDQVMTVSVADAYFYIASDDENIKVEGGSKEYSSSAWYIYTTESFDTYLFHIEGKTKNYMICDSTSFISSGGTRYDAVCEVLDNLFTSGKKIIVDTLADVIGKDNLDSASQAEHAGSRGDGFLTYELTQTGSGKADKDDEDENNIPVGTPYEIAIKVRYAWEKYVCVSEDVDQKTTFTLGDDTYVDQFLVNTYYQSEDVDIVYPDREAFTKVDDIFAL